MLITQGNLANSYSLLGRDDEALRLRRDVYFGWVKLHGEQHPESLREANNYADSLFNQKRFKEAKSLLRRTVPVARRVLGESNELAIIMGSNYAKALYADANATLDDLREAVETLEATERTARRVLGGAHPFVVSTERRLEQSRSVLRAREPVGATAPGNA